MLKKKNRLPASGFKASYPERKRSSLFVAKLKPNGLSFSRFGIVITKTTEKSAVERHRLRRTIYRWLREKQLSLTPSRDVIIFAQPESLRADKKNIAFALNELLS